MAEVPAGWVPTFALKPKDGERFVPKQAKAVVEEIVEASCKGLTYAADKCQALSMQIAEQIRDALHSYESRRSSESMANLLCTQDVCLPLSC